MRNPERIDEVIDVVTKVWKEHPDLRFMQLVLNVSEFYYMEDGEFLERFKKLYGVD